MSTEGWPPGTPPPPPPHPQSRIPRHWSWWALPSWIAPWALLIAAMDYAVWAAWLDRLPTT